MSTLEILRPRPHVAEVWLNRPEVRNAFNDGVIAELTAAFRALGAEPGLRAIVLGGRGKAFCAGADLSWMARMAGYTWDENRADAAALNAAASMNARAERAHRDQPSRCLTISRSAQSSSVETFAILCE